MKCQHDIDFRHKTLLMFARLRYGHQDGSYVIGVVFVMLLIVTSMLTAYVLLAKVETASTKASKNSNTGFYAAETGLNQRAEQIRERFQGFIRPSGTSPGTSANSWQNCIDNDSTNNGSGDFICSTQTVNNQKVVSYVEDRTPTNPAVVTIPPGEPFEGMTAQEYQYNAISAALNAQELPTAIQGMRFKNRLVPLFQFAVFYNKDLEISPGANMSLSGRVHTNSDLFLNAGSSNTLAITGQVSTRRTNIYRGQKRSSGSCSGTVNVHNSSALAALGCTTSPRTTYTNANLTAWNGRIVAGVPEITVPKPQEFDPTAGKLYWDKADMRIVLQLGSPNVIEVRNVNDTNNVTATTNLNSCNGIIGGSKVIDTTYSFFNNREKRGGSGTKIRMLEVDVQGLLNCIQAHKKGLDDVASAANKELDDETEGGLVWFLTVKGSNSSGINDYGVRLRNGGELKSTAAGAPAIKGLTVVSDQAIYIQGNYNSVNKKPASILADTINILSSAWSNDANSEGNLGSRKAADTTVNAAFLSATDSTGGAEGAGGWGGDYNGGLENYPRLHEDWSGKKLIYRGSFISLNTPRHVNGPWCGTGGGSCNIYNAPQRDWEYDTDFNNAANLPPLTPRVVYLRQEVFSRSFDR